MREPAVYSPGRAQQLRALLWVAVVLASVLVALAVWVLIVGSTLRYAFFLALPGVAVLVSALRTLRSLEQRGRSARRGAVGTGVLLVVFGLLLASIAVGLVPTITGILLLLLALVPDVGDH